MTLKSQDYIFVGVQFVLFVGFLLPLGPLLTDLPVWISYTGILFMIIGVLYCVVAALQLNIHLSPFPSPKKGSSLITNGVFTWARHPIYGGITIGLFGLGLYYESLYKMGLALLLLILFYYKSSYEEKRLEAVFPEYKVYKTKTKRFIPFVL